MYEKLLALLTAKFAQARKDGLQQLARSLALQVSEETEAQALVDKINETQVTEFIKDWRKDVDSEVTKSTKSFEENLKSKYDFVEKKTPNPKKTEPSNPSDISDIIAKAVAEAVKPLQEKITSFEAGKTVETRKEILLGKLNNAPEVFKKTVLKNFEKMNFDNDEDFQAFLSETEADSKTMEQTLANKGLSGFPHPNNSTSSTSKKEIQSDIEKWGKSNKKE